MEFFDGILYLLYLVLTIAIAVTIWSFVLLQQRSSKRGVVQGCVCMRILSVAVWSFVAMVVLVVALCCHGDIASIMLLTLAIMLLTTCLTIGWAMIKRR